MQRKEQTDNEKIQDRQRQGIGQKHTSGETRTDRQTGRQKDYLVFCVCEFEETAIGQRRELNFHCPAVHF